MTMADKNQPSSTTLSGTGFLWRLLAALALVLLTYNPSGQSAYHWIGSAIANSAFGPVHLILVAILLLSLIHI